MEVILFDILLHKCTLKYTPNKEELKSKDFVKNLLTNFEEIICWILLQGLSALLFFSFLYYLKILIEKIFILALELLSISHKLLSFYGILEQKFQNVHLLFTVRTLSMGKDMGGKLVNNYYLLFLKN